MTTFYAILADLVLLVHFAFVAFVVVGLVAVWVGYCWRWRWVRNVWFRVAHLSVMTVVVLESISGIVCPLTTSENELRQRAGAGEDYSTSFLQHWIHKVLFLDIEEGTFTVIYVVFLAALVLSFVLVRPGGKEGRGERGRSERISRQT